VENQLKLTESATDKNLSENARCFFHQEAKFPPSRLIWQLTIKQESMWQVHSTWTTDCCFACAILWLTIFGSLWLTSTLTQHYTSTLQTFNQWDFWNVVNKVLFVTKFPVVNLYSQLGMLLYVLSIFNVVHRCTRSLVFKISLGQQKSVFLILKPYKTGLKLLRKKSYNLHYLSHNWPF